MQKNLPKYAPPWVRTVRLWAEASKREVSYALCNDRRTLLWLANQRAVEFPTFLVLDLDPPSAIAFLLAVRGAHMVRQALADLGLAGPVKTSGAKDVHVFVPMEAQATIDDVAAATRALAARAERLGGPTAPGPSLSAAGHGLKPSGSRVATPPQDRSAAGRRGR